MIFFRYLVLFCNFRTSFFNFICSPSIIIENTNTRTEINGNEFISDLYFYPFPFLVATLIGSERKIE